MAPNRTRRPDSSAALLGPGRRPRRVRRPAWATQAALADAFAPMADDADYQAEAARLDAELAQAGWEALRADEADEDDR